MSHESIYVITEKELKAIQETHNKSDEEIQQYIDNIKQWIKQQSHLPQNENEQRLKNMLVVNKFSLEKVKNKLETYYSIKHLVPEVFTNNSPLNPQCNKMLHSLLVFPLPKLNHDLNRVYMFRYYKCAPEDFDTTILMKVFYMMQDVRVTYDPCLGDHCICDYREAKMGHFMKFTPAYIKKFMTILQEGYSDRIAGLHFLFLPSAAMFIVQILNSILPEKIANRVHVHENMESLHKFISKDILPVEYGGTYGKVEEINSKWKKYLESNNEWIRAQLEKKSDESKRIGKPFNTELFGMYGSFRQINVD